MSVWLAISRYKILHEELPRPLCLVCFSEARGSPLGSKSPRKPRVPHGSAASASGPLAAVCAKIRGRLRYDVARRSVDRRELCPSAHQGSKLGHKARYTRVPQGWRWVAGVAARGRRPELAVADATQIRRRVGRARRATLGPTWWTRTATCGIFAPPRRITREGDDDGRKEAARERRRHRRAGGGAPEGAVPGRRGAQVVGRSGPPDPGAGARVGGDRRGRPLRGLGGLRGRRQDRRRRGRRRQAGDAALRALRGREPDPLCRRRARVRQAAEPRRGTPRHAAGAAGALALRIRVARAGPGGDPLRDAAERLGDAGPAGPADGGQEGPLAIRVHHRRLGGGGPAVLPACGGTSPRLRRGPPGRLRSGGLRPGPRGRGRRERAAGDRTAAGARCTSSWTPTGCWPSRPTTSACS